MCNCGADIERTIHYLLHCWLYSVQRIELLKKLDSTLQNSLEDHLLTVLSYRSEKLALNVNKDIMRLAISFLKASERFAGPFFWPVTFVFTFSIYLFFLSIHLLFIYALLPYCAGLTVSDYILLQFCVLFHSQFYVLFYYTFYQFYS